MGTIDMAIIYYQIPELKDLLNVKDNSIIAQNN